jgi:ElaB/YqjD/DUF883 family membrane-anchored ribosome-binding protein
MTHSHDPLLHGGGQPAPYPVAAAPPPYPAGPPTGLDREPSAERQQPSTTDVAKDQAADVAGTARDAGKHVAGVAGEQAGQVASEATQQVKQLVHQTRSELTEQAAAQQQRVASGLRSLSKELSTMARGSEQSGMATDLIHQASERTNAVASWLEQREPGHVVDEVTRFARQRPGAFLALAAGAGLLVGRLGRGLMAANDDSSDGAAPPKTPNPSRVETTGTSGPGYASAPSPPVPTYPPTPGHDPTGGYGAAPGYPPPAPNYPPQAPSYPQPPAPRYQPPLNYPPQQAPSDPRRLSGRDLNP